MSENHLESLAFENITVRDGDGSKLLCVALEPAHRAQQVGKLVLILEVEEVVVDGRRARHIRTGVRAHEIRAAVAERATFSSLLPATTSLPLWLCATGVLRARVTGFKLSITVCSRLAPITIACFCCQH